MAHVRHTEKLIAVVRRYGLTLVPAYACASLMLSATFFFMFWFFHHDWWGQILFAMLVATSAYILIRTTILWKANVLYIMSDRIIDRAYAGIFDHVVSEVSYHQIEDVSSRITGIGGVLFRYGTLSIQTGQGRVMIEVEKIKNPQRIQELINRLRS